MVRFPSSVSVDGEDGCGTQMSKFDNDNCFRVPHFEVNVEQISEQKD